MKRMMSIWVLALAFMFAFAISTPAEEWPQSPPPMTGGDPNDGGDGHPWGGDDNSTGGSGETGVKRTVYTKPTRFTGIPAIDFVTFIIKNEWILSRFVRQSPAFVPSRIDDSYSSSQTRGETGQATVYRRPTTSRDRAGVR